MGAGWCPGRSDNKKMHFADIATIFAGFMSTATIIRKATWVFPPPNQPTHAFQF